MVLVVLGRLGEIFLDGNPVPSLSHLIDLVVGLLHKVHDSNSLVRCGLLLSFKDAGSIARCY